MTNNYLASARDALATPLTDWNKAKNNADRKASGLGAIATEHEIKSTDTFAPILGKDKVNPKSTASVELFAMLKELLVETCLLKPEQALYNFDLDAYRKKLGITLKEKSFNVAYQKKAQGKSAAIQKLGSKMRDFRDVIVTAEEARLKLTEMICLKQSKLYILNLVATVYLKHKTNNLGSLIAPLFFVPKKDTSCSIAPRLAALVCTT